MVKTKLKLITIEKIFITWRHEISRKAFSKAFVR